MTNHDQIGDGSVDLRQWINPPINPSIIKSPVSQAPPPLVPRINKKPRVTSFQPCSTLNTHYLYSIKDSTMQWIARSGWPHYTRTSTVYVHVVCHPPRLSIPPPG